jgi:hypothetical protein
VAVAFRTKPQIALQMLRDAQADGIPLGAVLGDVAYGNDSRFRDGISEVGRPYIVGVQSNMLVWKADAILPLQAMGGGKPSRPQSRVQQISAKHLALDQPAEAWQAVPWRDDGEAVSSRFARLPGHAGRATAGRVAADRMARRRGGADQVLAVHSARRDRLRGSGRWRQAALADRA